MARPPSVWQLMLESIDSFASGKTVVDSHRRGVNITEVQEKG